MIPIAEEDPKMGAEAPECDGNLPPLSPPTVGIRPVERIRYKGLQSPRSLSEAAYEAGHKDGYGDGYIDGYDDGRYNQLISLIKCMEEWLQVYPDPEGSWANGVLDAIDELRSRLEHDGRP